MDQKQAGISNDIAAKAENSAAARRSAAPESSAIDLPFQILQRMHATAGNRATGRWLQTKLKIGAPNDVFEQEADRVANLVVGASLQPTTSTAGTAGPHIAPGRLQRQTVEGDEEHSGDRPAKPAAATFTSQAKSDDTELQREPMRERSAPLSKGENEGGDEEFAELQRQPATTVLRRQCACGNSTDSPSGECAECKREHKPELQRAPASTAPIESAPPIVDEVLRSAGQPLDPPTRAFFEPRLARDLGSVRVHTDTKAARSADAVNANAYTVGANIAFGAARYRPDTQEGRRLLAHELTHVVQQTSPPMREGVAQRPPVSSSMPAMQRETPKTPDDSGSCPKDFPQGAGSAQPGDHTKGPSGTYYIYGARFNDESVATYSANAVDAWIVWRFGTLSPAAVSRIRSETVNWNWHWTTVAPAKGCQATLVMSIDDVTRLIRIAGYDVEARKPEKKEKEAGLPNLPEPAAITDNLIIVTASRSNPSAPSTSKTLSVGEQAEEALDPTSVYNRGKKGANYPPFPASMEGPEMEVPSGLGTYTMRLHYEEVTGDPAMLLAYGMNSVTYYWELFNITDLLKRGLGMGNSMLEEARQTHELAQNLDPNAQAAKAADGATGQHVRNDVQQLSEETKDSLRELRNPVKAAAGGSAIDVITRAYANFLNLELLPASAITAAGGALVHLVGDLLGGGYSKEKEIPLPEEQGFYMVRCIAQPGPRGPQHSERRAASVRSKIVEVRSPELLARNALGLPDAAIAQLQLQKILTSDPLELARLDKQIADIQEQTSGDIAAYLTRVIAEKEKDKLKLPSWRRGDAERELESLKLRLSQVTEKRAGAGNVHIRPSIAFTSTLTGETYPLMVELSPIPITDDNGKEVSGRKKVRLFDATVPDREAIEREGPTLEEAVENVFEIFRKNGDLGPGMLFVRMPANWKGKREFSLRVSASGGALVKRRLQDLATVLLALSVVVPGVGEISMALAAGLAAERLIRRALNHSLRLDAESVSDTLAILGAVAQGAQLVGKLRIVTKGDAFIGALRSTEQGALEAAALQLQAAMKLGKILDATSTVVNVGGLIWGDLVMVKRFSDIQTAELNGGLSHSEAARQRADLLAGAILQHGVMLHGLLQPQGADAAGGASKTETAPGSTAPKSLESPVKPSAPPGKPGDPPAKTPGAADPAPKAPGKAPDAPVTPRVAPKTEGPPETLPESELEQRAKNPATPGTESQPAPQKNGVRAKFRTPDNLHDIFILEDGRIFRCSLLCSQLRDWYDPYLKKQPEGTRSQRATELSGRLEALEARANAGEKSVELDQAIGVLDVAMREFIAPDLARELQQASEARKMVQPGETFLTEDQTRELLKFFNQDEIVKFTGPDGLATAKAVRDMAELLKGLDQFLTPKDRETLRPLLTKISEGGVGATNTIDFLNRVARIHDVPGVKFDLTELSAAFNNGDAILDHGPLQPKNFLEDKEGPYELEGGRLRLNGKESRLPKDIWRSPIDFVIFAKGETLQLVLGWEHTGLSNGRASVFAAGRLFFNKEGFVVKADRRSGHYRPSEANLRRAIQFLTEKGILLNGPDAKSLGRPETEIDPTF